MHGGGKRVDRRSNRPIAKGLFVNRRYVAVNEARHKIETQDGVEHLVIRSRRNYFIILFLTFWLCGWTVGGGAAIWELTTEFSFFLVFWLCGWAMGWLFAASTIVMQLGGSEIIRVVGGDLEISNGVGVMRRTWRYLGSEVANLQSDQPNVFGLPIRSFDYPFFIRPRTGAVRFDYGAASVYCAQGLDEPEGRTIVEWIGRRLPRANSRSA